jgi:hypothetical protein
MRWRGEHLQTGPLASLNGNLGNAWVAKARPSTWRWRSPHFACLPACSLSRTHAHSEDLTMGLDRGTGRPRVLGFAESIKYEKKRRSSSRSAR